MFIITDMEWITDKTRRNFATQLAGIKVDDKWEYIDSFSAFIRPYSPDMYNRKHMAYTGGSVYDFLFAKPATAVFNSFHEWLGSEDIILWWHSQSDNLFKTLSKILCKKDINEFKSMVFRHLIIYFKKYTNIGY